MFFFVGWFLDSFFASPIRLNLFNPHFCFSKLLPIVTTHIQCSWWSTGGWRSYSVTTSTQSFPFSTYYSLNSPFGGLSKLLLFYFIIHQIAIAWNLSAFHRHFVTTSGVEISQLHLASPPFRLSTGEAYFAGSVFVQMPMRNGNQTSFFTYMALLTYNSSSACKIIITIIYYIIINITYDIGYLSRPN